MDYEQKAQHAVDLLGEKVLVVLAKELDPESKVIELQDYIREETSFIPFFSSKESFDQSTNGKGLGKPLLSIDRRMFIQIVNPEHVFVLDAKCETEMSYTGEELQEIFPEALED